MKYYSVDRFEEDYAVLIDDDCRSITIPKSDLPKKTSPGNILTFDNEKYILAPEEEAKRRRKILNLQNKLFNK